MRKPANRADTPVAKSLHTLTVLFQVAGLILRNGAGRTPESALDDAMVALDLAGRADPHGLRGKALALLLADTAKEA